MTALDAFLRAREILFRHRADHEAACANFRWPELDRFNWALDYFDRYAEGNNRPALICQEDDGRVLQASFDELRRRSNQAANRFRRLGVGRGDRVMVMLGNVPPLWEVILGCMKLGAVIVPASTLLTARDLDDRISRGAIRHLVAGTEAAERVEQASQAGALRGKLLVGDKRAGWSAYAEVDGMATAFRPDGETRASDPLLLYFTSGTTAQAKLVLHTHESYPVGHLSTLYWIGLGEGDLHYNISSPGWAKHAWSSVFAPWNAGATSLAYNYTRFDGPRILRAIADHRITTLCAPPTVWRMLILEDLRAYRFGLKEIVSAGEPLNPEVIDHVKQAIGITIRDGFGQTETTALLGNSPGLPVKPGSTGKPLPGVTLSTLDLTSDVAREADEGEVAVRLTPERPTGLLVEYLDAPEKNRQVFRDGWYRTGDVARRDADGYFWYVGRSDDVFKSADYRISPFELESEMLGHPAVAETAVVASADPIRLAVPKVFVALKPGQNPSRALAQDLFRFIRQTMAPYKRPRRLEFVELPKTISGKIRRVELRQYDEKLRASDARGQHEYWESDFPELRE
jgi:acetyl-CoA synthetase